MFNWCFWKKNIFYILYKEEIRKNSEELPIERITHYMILQVYDRDYDGLVIQQPGMKFVNINEFYNIGWRYLKTLKCKGWDDEQLDKYKFSKSAHIITIGTKTDVV